MKFVSLKAVFAVLVGVFWGVFLRAESDPLQKELLARNFEFSGFLGQRVSKELRIEGRVEYILSGEIPLGFLPLNFLFDNLPTTAKMVNAYQETDYQVTYLDSDKKRFLARIKGLSGRMNLLTPMEQISKRVYYGDGEGNFLWWHLYGTVLAMVDITAVSEQTCGYELRIYLFNESAFVNGLLSLGVVRWAIKGRIRGILEHIVSSALAFRDDGGARLLGGVLLKSEQEKQFLQEFLRLDSLTRAFGESGEKL